MDTAVRDFAAEADVIIGAAAVADYHVAHAAAEKQKRGGAPLQVELAENPDIIGRVGTEKRAGQVVAGFAAETHGLLDQAQKKLARKNLDFIVANEVGKPDSGFGTEELRAILLDAQGGEKDLGHAPKAEVAAALLDAIALRFA
jgi:phosphopantothenoylcysteine decarboxylase/phosphopantothenate--cysteine ligase